MLFVIAVAAVKTRNAFERRHQVASARARKSGATAPYVCRSAAALCFRRFNFTVNLPAIKVIIIIT